MPCGFWLPHIPHIFFADRVSFNSGPSRRTPVWSYGTHRENGFYQLSPHQQSIWRRRVTRVSFLCDPHYVSYSNNAGFAIRGSVRRASGFVLVGMSSKCRGKISPHKSAGVHECVRYTRYDLVRMSLDENGA